MDSHVIVFNLYDKRPLGHFTGPFVKDEHDGFHHSRMTTLCGLIVHEHIWIQLWSEDGAYHQASLDESHRGTYLRRDHIEQIGRLCKRCERSAEVES